MRWLIGTPVLGTALLITAEPPSAPDTSGWKTLRDERMGVELRHPAAWRVGRSTGTLESVVLSLPAQGDPSRATMQLLVQRDINPRGLPIEQWYADQLAQL